MDHPFWIALFLIFAANVRDGLAINCYSCANDFVVWQWRHFFLKRNYGLTTSDPSCVREDVHPDTFQSCHSTCFLLYLNGTHKKTGYTRALGVVRGCSSQYMTDDQHVHLGLGVHSKASDIGYYLPANFDQYEIVEHWCFCATEYCNTQSCYGSGRYPLSMISKRGYQNYYGRYGPFMSAVNSQRVYLASTCILLARLLYSFLL